MNQSLGLLFALAAGICLGTMPGVRENTPWGKPTPAPKLPAISIAPPSPTPKPGDWIFDRASSLDKPAHGQRK